MTTFIKTKLKKTDDQKNPDKFRVAVNYRISYIRIILPKNHHPKIYDDLGNYF